MYSLTSLIATPEDFDKATVNVQSQSSGDGHIAAVKFLLDLDGDVTLQASGDGARVLVEGLRLLADRVEAARTEWLRTKKAEHDREGA